MDVTVVCPTTISRRHFHASTYANFSRQQPPVAALLVFEDGGPDASPFWIEVAKRDKRVKYLHHASTSSIGHKRNILARVATTTWLVNFDDDDFYSVHYIATMLTEERKQSADIVCLHSWPHLNTKSKIPELHLYDVALSHNQVYAYGFSHCHRRSLKDIVEYNDINWNEDTQRIEALIGAYPSVRIASVGHPEDGTVLACHIQHANNTSTMPQVWLRSLPWIVTISILHQIFTQLVHYMPQLELVQYMPQLEAHQGLSLSPMHGLGRPWQPLHTKHAKPEKQAALFAHNFEVL